MRSERDLGADALYIYVHDAPIGHTEPLSDGTVVDVSPDGDLVGIEILTVSSGWDWTALAERFPLSDFDKAALKAITHPPVVSVASNRRPDASSVGSNALNAVPEHV